MNVAHFSTKPYDKEYFERFNTNELHSFTFFDASLNALTANLGEGFNAICVFVNDNINAETLGILAGNGVKLIVLRCAGFNNIDLQAAARCGIIIARVPAYSPEAVAEHSVALILTLNRKTHKAYNRVREGNFSLQKLMGFNLQGKTVAVIGTGRIGSAFCKIMLGFGCTVLAYDLVESTALKNIGVQYKRLIDLWPLADIISLHCPLTADTQHLLNAEVFHSLRKGTMLINSSRGALINTAAAIDALKTGQLGYLGIDVYEQEENLFFHDLSGSIIQDDVFERLMGFHNVLITPHQGFFTSEALEEITKTTLRNLTDFEKGLPLVNEVKL